MKKASPLFLLLGSLLLFSCSMFEANKPLRERLQGEWLLTTSTTTTFDSLGNQEHKLNPLRYDNGRSNSIYTFQDSTMNIERLVNPVAFHYELKDGEGEGLDSILLLDYSRAYPIQRIGVTFPDEDRMQWHTRSSFATPPNSPTTVENVNEFIRIVRKK